jgi:Ca-activated chloride channel family protein
MDGVGYVSAAFEFLRPNWLLVLLALPLLAWWQRRRHRDGGAWQRAVDPHLLPHLLQRSRARRVRAAPLLTLLGATLAIVALAGPSWRQQQVPLWQVQAPLLIALDLSSAMRAADLPPSRLVRARHALAALLAQRQGGQVGLLAFAGDAFTVAPITPDAHTVQALLDSLDPDLMPVDGQRVERAIERARRVARAAGFDRGDILVVTNTADDEAVAAARRAHAVGFRVSVLGVGTPAGAPVTGKQGFVTGADGRVQLARLDSTQLAALASAGGGTFVALSGATAADLRALGLLDPQGAAQAAAGPANGSARGVQRSDDGYWLVLLLLPLALLGFRRGVLAMVPLALATSLAAPHVHAASSTTGSEATAPLDFDLATAWASLWQRDDQRARRALERGEHERARALAPDAALAGAAAYRADDFDAAAAAWAEVDDADAHYNRGNALARAGKLEDALVAYDAALERAPGMPDAVANREAVAELLEQQQRHQQQQQQQRQQPQRGDQRQPKDEGESQQQAGQGRPSSGESRQPDADDAAQNQANGGGASESQPGSDTDTAQQGESAEEQAQAQAQENREGQARDGTARDSREPGAPADEPQAETSNAAAQREADEAARREMEQALAGDAGREADEQASPRRALSAEERSEAEQRQAHEQWLRRVPDDPGGLLRRKFAIEYRRRQQQGDAP